MGIRIQAVIESTPIEIEDDGSIRCHPLTTTAVYQKAPGRIDSAITMAHNQIMDPSDIIDPDTVTLRVTIPTASRGPRERAVVFHRDPIDGVWRSEAICVARVGRGKARYARTIELSDTGADPIFDPSHDLGTVITGRRSRISEWLDPSGKAGFSPTARIDNDEEIAAAEIRATETREMMREHHRSDGAYRTMLLSIATGALRGEVTDINIRRDGSIALLNAGKDMIWTGFSPEAELLKGLVVAVDDAAPGGPLAVDLVAGCLPKFYNYGESSINDAAFFEVVRTPGAHLVFTLKVDGSNLRNFVHPDTGRVEFATRGMLPSQSGEGGYLDFCGIARAIAVERFPALLDSDLARRYTVVTEMIHPTNRIITDYGDRRDLPVITVIDLATGAEMTRTETEEFCRHHHLSITDAIASPSGDFDAAVTALRRQWGDSDAEGCVVSVERGGVPTHARLKVKSFHYLALVRMANLCSIGRTREICEREAVRTWEDLRVILMRDLPDLPEEIQMGYREHFLTWKRWDDEIRSRVADLVVAYERLSSRTADQKTFALSIASDPDRAAFFLLRNDHGDRLAALRSLEALVRKGMIDRLAEMSGTETPTLLLGSDTALDDISIKIDHHGSSPSQEKP